MKKKILFVLFAVAVLTVLFAISVSAAEPFKVIDISKDNDGSVVASFYETEEYIGTAYKDGVYVKMYGYSMTVTGNGKMRDFEYGPWTTELTQVRYAIVDGGVTNIGAHLFYGAYFLKEVKISDSVTEIGEWAFFDTAINYIKVPDSVTAIGEFAFSCCSLKSIFIPDSVTSIGSGAFLGSTGPIIYCGAESKPDGWHNGWNPENCPVEWGHNEEDTCIEDVFTFKGYSFGWKGQISIGFDINYKAKSFIYEIGVVFAGYDNLGGKQPLGENGQVIKLEVGKAIKTDLTKYHFTSYDFMLTDIDDSIKDVKLVISAYIYDGEVVKYIQENGLSDTVSGVSYNEAKMQ